MWWIPTMSGQYSIKHTTQNDYLITKSQATNNKIKTERQGRLTTTTTKSKQNNPEKLCTLLCCIITETLVPRNEYALSFVLHWSHLHITSAHRKTVIQTHWQTRFSFSIKRKIKCVNFRRGILPKVTQWPINLKWKYKGNLNTSSSDECNL